ncbi:MAG: hypothetical protein IPK82_25540 [Polyangiaceae bacterium]|nr:hypothetical protein [Polyangiaceae bacterium]
MVGFRRARHRRIVFVLPTLLPVCISALGFSAACGDGNSATGQPIAADTHSATSTASAAPVAAQTASTGASAAPESSASAPPSASVTAAPAASSAAVAAKPGESAQPAATASATPTSTASAAAAASATATAAAAEPALTVQSPAVQEATFSAFMSSAKSYKVGQPGFVDAVLVPKGDYHCNEKYPYKVKLGAAPAGVSFPSDIVRGASVATNRASIRIPFTPTAAGDARISGKFYFSVCKADQCVIDVRDVGATVKIEP